MPKIIRHYDHEVRAITNGEEGFYEGGKFTRKRERISKSWHHVLTDRQLNVLKGKRKFSRGWSKVVMMLRETEMTMEDFVKTLSAEELVRGQLKDKNGTFRGAPPIWVPRVFHRACIAELMRRGKQMWQGAYLDSIKAMADIAAGRGTIGAIATPGERIKAAQFVVERMEGKVPEKLVVTDDKAWKLALEDIVADVPDEAIDKGRRALEASGEDIIDAEVVYEDEEEEPPPRPARSRRGRK